MDHGGSERNNFATQSSSVSAIMRDKENERSSTKESGAS